MLFHQSPKNCHDKPVDKYQGPENACSRQRGCAVTNRTRRRRRRVVVVGPDYVALSGVLSAPFCRLCHSCDYWLVVVKWFSGCLLSMPLKVNMSGGFCISVKSRTSMGMTFIKVQCYRHLANKVPETAILKLKLPSQSPDIIIKWKVLDRDSLSYRSVVPGCSASALTPRSTRRRRCSRIRVSAS